MTEEQKEIVLLGSRYEIMNKYVDLSNADKEFINGIAEAMQDYAELFHNARTRKLHLDAVISSVCDCENKKYEPLMSGQVKCLRCGKMIAPTDL